MPLLRICILFLTLFLCMPTPPTDAADLYSQPPFTRDELNKLIDDLPRFRAWARANKQTVHPTLAPDGKPDFLYSPQAAAQAESLGWKAERFFCVMGRAAAAVAVIEQGPGITSDPPPDMPGVTPGEMRIVQDNLSTLLKAVTGR